MSVYVCVYVSVTALAATYLVRRHTVSCRLLRICIVWTLLKTFRLGDMTFACRDDRQLWLFLDKKHATPVVLDIRNGIVHKPLARSDD